MFLSTVSVKVFIFKGPPKGCQQIPIGLLQSAKKQHGWTQTSKKDKNQESDSVIILLTSCTKSRQPKLFSRAVIHRIFYTFGDLKLK